jgi:hypothetical protein
MTPHRNAKLTVEECRIFDVGSLKQILKSVDHENSLRGIIEWRDSFGTLEAVLGYEVGRIKSEGLILLTDPERTSPFPASVRLLTEYEISITSTPTRIGGPRHWFGCPIRHRGRSCGRRVKKLYLPPGEQVFGCRICHDLTYKSVQTHDNRRTTLARDPDALDAALSSEDFRRTVLGIGGLVLLGKWSRQGRMRQLANVSELMREEKGRLGREGGPVSLYRQHPR